MKVDVVCKPNNLAEDFGITLFDYKTSVAMAFSIIEKNTIISSWKDSFSSSLPVGSLIPSIWNEEMLLIFGGYWKPTAQ